MYLCIYLLELYGVDGKSKKVEDDGGNKYFQQIIFMRIQKNQNLKIFKYNIYIFPINYYITTILIFTTYIYVLTKYF